MKQVLKWQMRCFFSVFFENFCGVERVQLLPRGGVGAPFLQVSLRGSRLIPCVCEVRGLAGRVRWHAELRL